MDPAVSKAPADRTLGPTVWVLVLAGVGPFILALAVAISCYLACGMTLGLFFGPMLLLTFLTPPLAVSGETLRCRLLVCAGLFLGVWLPWAFALTFFEAARCGCVLTAYVVALTGSAAFLDQLGMGKTFAAALVVLGGFTWLTWPVWLMAWVRDANAQFIGMVPYAVALPIGAVLLYRLGAGWKIISGWVGLILLRFVFFSLKFFGVISWPHGLDAQGLVQDLTAAHPLMALNTALFERFNFWDRYTITYQHLTTLNQDVFYALPKGVFLMTVTHFGLGIAGIFLAELLQKRENHRAIGVITDVR